MNLLGLNSPRRYHLQLSYVVNPSAQLGANEVPLSQWHRYKAGSGGPGILEACLRLPFDQFLAVLCVEPRGITVIARKKHAIEETVWKSQHRFYQRLFSNVPCRRQHYIETWLTIWPQKSLQNPTPLTREAETGMKSHVYLVPYGV
jgi:hypothetical protein